MIQPKNTISESYMKKAIFSYFLQESTWSFKEENSSEIYVSDVGHR